MIFCKIAKFSSIAIAAFLLAPLSLAATPVKATSPAMVKDAGSMRSAIDELHTQIQAIANIVPKELAAQDKNNQKALLNVEEQTQAQIKHLQQEIQQTHDQFQKEIAKVQNEVHQEALIK